ncbi:MAG: hypothetical protein K9M07_07765 [Simkaniaceae bacterium]|nr:hypothetical protein [Simkaniaceae bacterium]MCF7853117.1 hypothetical protein [Simkaniaceae bacterium]
MASISNLPGIELAPPRIHTGPTLTEAIRAETDEKATKIVTTFLSKIKDERPDELNDTKNKMITVLINHEEKTAKNSRPGDPKAFILYGRVAALKSTITAFGSESSLALARSRTQKPLAPLSESKPSEKLGEEKKEEKTSAASAPCITDVLRDALLENEAPDQIIKDSLKAATNEEATTLVKNYLSSIRDNLPETLADRVTEMRANTHTQVRGIVASSDDKTGGTALNRSQAICSAIDEFSTKQESGCTVM